MISFRRENDRNASGKGFWQAQLPVFAALFVMLLTLSMGIAESSHRALSEGVAAGAAGSVFAAALLTSNPRRMVSRLRTAAARKQAPLTAEAVKG
ncbi:hypothetical protein ACFQBQ_14145 [Granulicella cerasi]|uniref:Uncharacterized protein n=1 Tax=Granulicella cerasi TaxID=741063 RepID=A0ABW1ZDC6_9BACT|nr:hypothetical protein [Granulicella cerasi]